MKVLFDHQLFSYQRFGGASKYFAMLLNSLPEDIWDTTTLFSNNEYVKNLNLLQGYHNFLPDKYFRGQGKIMNILNKPYSIYRLLRQDYDVFHQTHFETYCIKPNGKKPMVTTFHDINFSTYSPNPHIVKLQAESLERADAVIAISHNTKKDLLSLFNINEEKVHVIHHGIDSPHYMSEERVYAFPYILYVGSRQNHKNFSTFVKAYSVFQQKYPEIKVICTLRAFSDSEMAMFASYGVQDKFIHVQVSEQMMPMLYRDALFFVFPSLYEGFGMPILEAMINDCPVVLSDASCFPEIAGNAGLYFDPHDSDSMLDKMVKMAESEELRSKFRKLGRAKVKEYSWDRCAELHMNVYRSLI